MVSVIQVEAVDRGSLIFQTGSRDNLLL